MNTTVTRQDAELVSKVAAFCWHYRGRRCFDGWSLGKLFRYVAFNHLDGTLFVEWADGMPALVACVWSDNEQDILKKEAAGLPPWCWERTPKTGDAIMVGNLVGDRRHMPALFDKVRERWPDMPRMKVYAHREHGGKPVLVELSMELVRRFSRQHA